MTSKMTLSSTPPVRNHQRPPSMENIFLHFSPDHDSRIILVPIFCPYGTRKNLAIFCLHHTPTIRLGWSGACVRHMDYSVRMVTCLCAPYVDYQVRMVTCLGAPYVDYHVRLVTCLHVLCICVRHIQVITHIWVRLSEHTCLRACSRSHVHSQV